MIATMNRVMRWLAFGVTTLVLTSCGIPGLATRTVDNTFKQLGELGGGGNR